MMIPNTSIPNIVDIQFLRLISKKIPIKFCEFKISNDPNKMIAGESISLSKDGILFFSPTPFAAGSIMRVWIEIPGYWSMKSKHVEYGHTDAPFYFQALSRVVNCEEIKKRHTKYQIACESISIDPVDQSILQDYLSGHDRK